MALNQINKLVWIVETIYKANKKMDAYMDAFVRIPLPQKSTQEILFMAMLDIAVVSMEYKQSYQNSSLLGKIKNILK